MRKLFFAIFFLTVSALVVVGQTPCKTLYAPQGAGFTMCPPDTLTKITRGGTDAFCKSSDYARDKCSPATLTFAIIFDGQIVPDSIEAMAFASAVDPYKKNVAADLKAMDYFVTSSGDKGTRTVVEYAGSGGKRYVMVWYWFRAAKGTFGGFTLQADSPELELVDSVMKTVTIAK